MSEDLKRRLRATLPRDLIIDLLDMAEARTRMAFELVRDHTDLTGKSGRALEGQARFRFMEKGFQATCELHGGVMLEGGVIVETGLRFYQPFMRFGAAEPGVVLGFASMPVRRELPVKNQSRSAGVSLNVHLQPGLDLDDRSAKSGDVFALLLVARDPARAGYVDEIAIGVIDALYSGYLVYCPIEDFLSGYADGDGGVKPSQLDGSQPLVTLRPTRRLYQAPEAAARNDDATGDAG